VTVQLTHKRTPVHNTYTERHTHTHPGYGTCVLLMANHVEHSKIEEYQQLSADTRIRLVVGVRGMATTFQATTQTR
jgi:hypothetical protein